MRELRLVTVDTDGGRLVLEGDGGSEGAEQFVLPVTDALRAAVRPDRGRTGQLEIALESQLTPKEIQTRIRHGESAEDVARAAGVPVERVRRFEGAVLAERAHIAEQAQRSSLRRGEPGSSALLAEAVAARLRSRGLDADSARWDAWRREDGRWTVEVTFRAGGGDKRGRFTYDPTARASVPADGDGSWLAGDERAAESKPAPRGPRLVVPGDRLPEPDDAPEPNPVRVELASVPAEADGPDAGAADSGAADSAASAGGEPDRTVLEQSPEGDPQQIETAASAGRRGSRRNRRSSVPSWDEIVFGRKNE